RGADARLGLVWASCLLGDGVFKRIEWRGDAGDANRTGNPADALAQCYRDHCKSSACRHRRRREYAADQANDSAGMGRNVRVFRPRAPLRARRVTSARSYRADPACDLLLRCRTKDLAARRQSGAGNVGALRDSIAQLWVTARIAAQRPKRSPHISRPDCLAAQSSSATETPWLSSESVNRSRDIVLASKQRGRDAHDPRILGSAIISHGRYGYP